MNIKFCCFLTRVGEQVLGLDGACDGAAVLLSPLHAIRQITVAKPRHPAILQLAEGEKLLSSFALLRVLRITECILRHSPGIPRA